MPYEYPVNWDALILLYQGTTRGFIVSKTLKMAIFQPKMALNCQNLAITVFLHFPIPLARYTPFFF